MKPNTVKWVYIATHTREGLVARVICELVGDGPVVCRDLQNGKNTEIMADLAMGIAPYANRKLITVKDGEEFLKALALEYKTPYLGATGVREGTEVLPINPPAAA